MKLFSKSIHAQRSGDVINEFMLFHSDTDNGVIAVKYLATNVLLLLQVNPTSPFTDITCTTPNSFHVGMTQTRQPEETQSGWESSVSCDETKEDVGNMATFHSRMKYTLIYLQLSNFWLPRWWLSHIWHDHLQEYLGVRQIAAFMLNYLRR